MMLWRHGLYYLAARGGPGLVSLLAIVLYTRLLTPEQYGRYALVIAGVGLANKLAFEWLRLALLRFRPALPEPQMLFATIGAAFLALVVLSGVVGAGAILFVDPTIRGLVGMGLALLWLQALFELELERARSELAPRRYGLMAFVRAALGLATGAALVLLGFGAAGPVLGLLAAMLVALVPPLLQILPGFRLALCDPALMRRIAAYGAPLAATGSFSFLIGNADRFLLGWLIDDAAVGRYAVVYDLASFSLGLLLMVVNLAAYPLAVRALEERGAAAARLQLQANLRALLALGLPATVGLMVLARPLAELILGAGFRDQAGLLIPLIALGALLRDLKAYYADVAFFLGRNTLSQMWVTVSACLLNTLLNLWWIPAYGILGAAAAAIAAYLFGLATSVVLGRRVFALPHPGADELKIAFAAVGMGGLLWLLGDSTNVVELLARILFGVLSYAGLLWLFDTAGMRAYISALARPSGAARSRE
jgi:O-antigen/teichoic acid export membrane protein